MVAPNRGCRAPRQCRGTSIRTRRRRKNCAGGQPGGAASSGVRVGEARAPPGLAVGRGGQLVQAQRVRGDAPAVGGQPAADGQQRLGGQVGGEQPDGAEPAGVRQLGQRRGERQPGGHADRGLQRRRDDHRLAAALGDPARGGEPAERGDLDDDDVGRAEDRGGQRVAAAAAYRLVDGDRHGHPQPQLGELLEGAAGLLGVLQAVRHERAERLDGLLERPGGVGVDADPAGRAERLADRGDPLDVVAQGLAGLADLDLGGPAAGGLDEGVRDGGLDGGDDRVDRHPRVDRRGPLAPAGLERGAQPGRGLGGVVLGERPPLAPAARPLEEHRLAHLDPAEAHPHRDAHHVGALLEVVEGGDRVRGVGVASADGPPGGVGGSAGVVPSTVP